MTNCCSENKDWLGETKVECRDLLYSGKAKDLFLTNAEGLCIQRFTDKATAFNGKKRAEISEKGFYNHQISAALFAYLETKGVPTHFVKKLSDRDMLVKRVEIVPIEVVIRNIVAGSLASRLGWEEGRELPSPLVEWYYKSDALGDPMLSEDHILLLSVVTKEELASIKAQALHINGFLVPYFRERNLLLVDYKLEFGKCEGKIVLADEISPDTCRIWDTTTRKKLDKDRFRRDLGDIEDAYAVVYKRIAQSHDK